MKRFHRVIIASLIAIYLIVSIRALPLYGVNWDESNHFGRGHAILYFFLTGKKIYSELIDNRLKQGSFFQNITYSFTFFEKKLDETPVIIGGHPPLSGILAAITNVVFYQKLRLFGDIESFHLYSIIIVSIFIGVLYYFVKKIYGFFAGIMSVVSLIAYPLFLGESRFNIKDVPEASFYGITLICFYFAVSKKNFKWVLLTAISFGFGLATKLNIVFALGIMFLWASFVYLGKSSQKDKERLRKLLLYSLVLIPLIGALTIFLSWPLLWGDPVKRVLGFLTYYKTIGKTSYFDPRFLTFYGFNTYAIQWILYTTPLVTLFFAFIGIFYALRQIFKEKYASSFLLLLWFFIPIIRVSMPKANIYGGVRQIMEYIPAMAILSGIGAKAIVERYKYYNRYNRYKNYSFILQILILLSFLPITLKLISLHPNESVYFNPLIGGLKGAKERNIPGWGNSLGSTYRQGIQWLNVHAEPNAKLATIYELRSNIALINLRSDIDFQNRYRSAIHRDGGYLIGVTHEGTHETSYSRLYAERYLDPVYQLVIDGVPLLKIWKNDLEHTKNDYKKPEQALENFTVSKGERTVVIDLGNIVKLTKIHIEYDDQNCTPPTVGYFEYAINNSLNWQRIPGDFKSMQFIGWFKTQPTPGVLDYLFAAQDARYLQMVLYDDNSCLLTRPLMIQLFHI